MFPTRNHNVRRQPGSSLATDPELHVNRDNESRPKRAIDFTFANPQKYTVSHHQATGQGLIEGAFVPVYVTCMQNSTLR